MGSAFITDLWYDHEAECFCLTVKADTRYFKENMQDYVIRAAAKREPIEVTVTPPGPPEPKIFKR